MGEPQSGESVDRLKQSGQAAEPPRPLSLEQLRCYPQQTLKWRSQQTVRVVRHDTPQGPVVLKEWNPTRNALQRRCARFLMNREMRHYATLAGVPGIPRLIAAYGPGAFAIDFVEGDFLTSDLSKQDPARVRCALDTLKRTVDAIHSRYFCHLDLRQRRNIIVDRDGQAWLLDLAQGIDCSRRVPRRLIFPLLSRIDRSALLKYRARYAPETLDPHLRSRYVSRLGRRRNRWYFAAIRRLLKALVLRN